MEDEKDTSLYHLKKKVILTQSRKAMFHKVIESDKNYKEGEYIDVEPAPSEIIDVQKNYSSSQIMPILVLEDKNYQGKDIDPEAMMYQYKKHGWTATSWKELKDTFTPDSSFISED